MHCLVPHPATALEFGGGAERHTVFAGRAASHSADTSASNCGTAHAAGLHAVGRRHKDACNAGCHRTSRLKHES